jgi:PAS domain S-box-containing protein
MEVFLDPLPAKTRRARYPFIAKVTIEHLKSGTLVDGITSDLSEGGCGVRVPELFSGGTRVLAKITKSGTTLVTPATVTYSLPPAAMGLAFVDMPRDQKQTLAGWLKTAIPTGRRNVREEGPSNEVVDVFSQSPESKSAAIAFVGSHSRELEKSGGASAMSKQKAYISPRLIRHESGADLPDWAKNVIQPLRDELLARSRTRRQVPPVYTTVVDSDRRYIEVSDSFSSLLGYGPKELIGKRYDDVSEPNINDIPTIFSLFSRLGYMHGLWMLLHRTGARVLVRYEAWLRPDSCIEANMELVEWLTTSARPGPGLTQ